ncbi:hypothetical protein Bca4012_001654 [Brassica carinata]
MDLLAHLLEAEFELGDLAYGCGVGAYWGVSARRVSLGSKSSETWSPPVAVGLVLKRRRRICWGRPIWPSEAVSAATKAANWSLVVFWTSS